MIETTRMKLQISRVLLLRLHQAADAEGIEPDVYARAALREACERTEAKAAEAKENREAAQ